MWEGKQKWKQRERDKERKQVNANKKQELGDRFCVILCFFLGGGGGWGVGYCMKMLRGGTSFYEIFIKE